MCPGPLAGKRPLLTRVQARVSPRLHLAPINEPFEGKATTGDCPFVDDVCRKCNLFAKRRPALVILAAGSQVRFSVRRIPHIVAVIHGRAADICHIQIDAGRLGQGCFCLQGGGCLVEQIIGEGLALCKGNIWYGRRDGGLGRRGCLLKTGGGSLILGRHGQSKGECQPQNKDDNE